jgi:FtsH-binding integral membrane protein
VPDDFKFSTTVGAASIDIRHAFIRKVYAILSAQLVLTAILSSISFFNADFKTWIQNSTWMIILSFVGSIGFLGATYWKRKSYPANLLLLSGFTAFEAYTVAVVTSFYDSRIVLQAVVITGALFIALTLFACQTKYDFTSWYTYLYGILWLVLIFGMVSLFFPHNGMLELVYSGVCALLFSAYIVSFGVSLWIAVGC